MKMLLLILTSWILSSVTPALATPPAPSPEMEALLREFAQLSPRSFIYLRVAEARRQPTIADAVASLLAKSKRVPSRDSMNRTYDIVIKTSPADLPARVYRPKGDGILPVILYFHGGGFVVADLDVYETSAAALARRSGAIVIAVEYRKAPENKFPAAHDDAFNSYKWALINVAFMGGDGTRIAVAGEGAGGNLAVNVAIRARDEKYPPPRHVLAITPIADGTGKTESYREFANSKPLGRALMSWFLAQYLSLSSEALDPRISLVRADLRNLPPTTVMTAQIDPLRSEGETLFDRLRFAGVPAEYRLYPGVTHDFFGAGDVLSEARAAQAYAAARIKESFRATY